MTHFGERNHHDVGTTTSNVVPLLLRGTKPKLACVTTYFNPCGYSSLLKNYHRFREQSAMRDVPLITIELSFDGIFHIPDATMHVQGGVENILWQKERLINLAVERLDQSYDAVAYIDADLLFANPAWYEIASEYLTEALAVQLFEHIHYMNPDGQLINRRKSVVPPFGKAENCGWNPGGAWAIDRRLFPLIDFDPVGGNDALQFASWMPTDTRYLASILPSREYEAFTAIRERTLPRVTQRLKHVPGHVDHLYHGSQVNRRYDERSGILRLHDFDPDVDIVVDHQGLWRWTGTKPLLQTAVRDYFFGRKEDEPFEAPTCTPSCQNSSTNRSKSPGLRHLWSRVRSRSPHKIWPAHNDL